MIIIRDGEGRKISEEIAGQGASYKIKEDAEGLYINRFDMKGRLELKEGNGLNYKSYQVSYYQQKER